jgi:hypothetical protein
MNLEVHVENYLVKRVEQLGGVAYKLVAVGKRGKPDRLVILPGVRPFLVELKRPSGGRLAELQKLRIAELRRLGATVYDDVRNKEDVDRILKQET